MNNREWLYSLDVADLSDWFDAEHVEHQERALDGDTEPESSNTDAVSERYATAFRWLDRLGYGKGGVVGGSFCDTPEQGEVVMPLESWREHLDTEPENENSREQLEADIRELMRNLYEIGYTDAKLNYGILGKETRPRLFTFDEKRGAKFIELLDRQAAITAEETSNALEEYRDATQREIAELTAELEKATNNLNSANEDFENARAELTAERDKLQEQLRIGWECECRLQAERERYREKFGKCLDYADAIHALMDEGMA